MDAKKAPTLKDVAKYAGVSTATVSRCINTPKLVQPNTRSHIEAAIEQLGYTPNFGAKVLASKRTDTVGAVIPTMDNAIFARGLQAFQEEMADAGVTMLAASSGYDTRREAEQIRALVGRGADGLLLIGTARPNATYEFLQRRKVPYVIAWNYRTDRKGHYAGFNNRHAACELAELVLSQGHRKIAMIAGITLFNDRAADRIAGVRDALAKAEIPTANFDIVESKYSMDAGGEAFAELMSRTQPPTAILCGNDVLAVGAIKRAREIELSVPGDVSVVGFDDIELATVVEPSLTTVHVPHKQMGRAAARLLLKLRDGRSDSESVELPTYIVERQSLRPVPVKQVLSP
jgi:LacI family transcriptional regulator